eukprot:GHVU01104338.1.p1 GENE.GHVU01104338.1~~GHVU01104338.1.p1  ORF type:complete len:347 (+),score=72.29 GHVU01104338.1:159-1199(+)
MTAIASKNLYELLGNDHDEDSDKEPEPPVKVIDKTPARTTKRNAGDEAPAAKAPITDNRGSRRGGASGNEGAFRDRNAGSSANRSKPIGEADRGGRGGRGRGDRGPRRGGDRHSRTVGGDSEKQAAHGWGATEGVAELKDEEAGEAIAQTEQKEAETETAAADAEPKEEEPVDNSISYEEYQKQLEEKRQALAADTPAIRKPNEGNKLNEKWANAKAIVKEDEEAFIAGAAKAKKERKEQAKKEVLQLESSYYTAPQTGRPTRGGRGDGPRRGGDRGSGEHRGGDRPPRGDGSRGGRGRDGASRGGRGRGEGGDRAAFRGGAPARAGARGNGLNTADTNAFPSLGA